MTDPIAESSARVPGQSGSGARGTDATAQREADLSAFQVQLARVNQAISTRATELSSLPTTSTPEIISDAIRSLPGLLPEAGLGLEATTDLLLDSICPALSVGGAGPRFFGLVTGGVLPIAQLADQLVTSYDPNVQVHLPEETISTTLEHLTYGLLLSLLSLPAKRYTHNTLTTGATASNVLGLALGREHAIALVQARRGIPSWSCADDGFAGIDVDVFCARAHFSVAKAASIVGIGRRNVCELVLESEDEMCAFDLVELERCLGDNVGKRGSVVVMSFAEVNTGAFTPGIKVVRDLCDRYDAWLHVDAAFGAFAVLLPEFAYLAEDLALADSITSDAHKWLNQPYDCGLFFSRTPNLYTVCGPGASAPAYLSTSSSALLPTTSFPDIDPFRNISPPLFSGIENSRRLRALPLYASLVSLGRNGFEEIVRRNVEFARKIERWMRSGGGSGGYQVLTPAWEGNGASVRPESFKTLNIVLFAPSSSAPLRYQGTDGATVLTKAINSSRECYVTATKWKGAGAIRLAVSNWGTELERDFAITVAVLERVMRE